MRRACVLAIVVAGCGVDVDAGDRVGVIAQAVAWEDRRCATADDCPRVDEPCLESACIWGTCRSVYRPAGTQCEGGWCGSTGTCQRVTCEEQPGCDDGLSCTADRCVDGWCVNAAIACCLETLGPPVGVQCNLPCDCADLGPCWVRTCTYITHVCGWQYAGGWYYEPGIGWYYDPVACPDAAVYGPEWYYGTPPTP